MSWNSHFTPENDAAIEAARQAGEGWTAIGRRLFSRENYGACVRQRAHVAKLNCIVKPLSSPAKPAPSEREMAGPAPLPTFHPIAAAILYAKPLPTADAATTERDGLPVVDGAGERRGGA